MPVTRAITKFAKDSDGAVTVDWVVMTAAVVGLALTVIFTVQDAATDPAESLAARLLELDF